MNVFWYGHKSLFEQAGYRLHDSFLRRFDSNGKPREDLPFTVCYTCQTSSIVTDPPNCVQDNKILRAIRVKDSVHVAIKPVNKQYHPHEMDIATFFSSPPVSGDSKNHCVPILDVLQSPRDENAQFIVMPELRLFSDPWFDTVAELVEAFRQIFEVT